MNSHLKILQYNVHTTEGKVMAPLLSYHHISELFFLCYTKTLAKFTHPHYPQPIFFIFLSLFPPSADASVCFFLNKSLNLSSYSVAFLAPKYGYLCLRSSVQGATDFMI
jgi:hypothetical protein